MNIFERLPVLRGYQGLLVGVSITRPNQPVEDGFLFVRGQSSWTI